MNKRKREKTAPATPCLPVDNFGLQKVSAFTFQDEDEFSEVAVEDGDLSGQEASLICLKRSFLKRIRLSDSILQKIQVVDVRIDSCDISNSDLGLARLSRLEIANSKFTGVRINAAKISDCLFIDSLGEMTQFSTGKFERVHFRNCKLNRADFRACDLSSVSFIDCELEEAEFYGAKLSGTDFRGSDISKIKLHAADLKGAVIDETQALNLSRLLARLLEIVIE